MDMYQRLATQSVLAALNEKSASESKIQKFRADFT